jgi:hypothetical protein
MRLAPLHLLRCILNERDLALLRDAAITLFLDDFITNRLLVVLLDFCCSGLFQIGILCCFRSLHSGVREVVEHPYLADF